MKLFSFGKRKNGVQQTIFAVVPNSEDQIMSVIDKFANNHDIKTEYIDSVEKAKKLISGATPHKDSDVLFLFAGSYGLSNFVKAMVTQISNPPLKTCCIVKANDIKSIIANIAKSVKPVEITAFFNANTFSVDKIERCFIEQGLLKSEGKESQDNFVKKEKIEQEEPKDELFTADQGTVPKEQEEEDENVSDFGDLEINIEEEDNKEETNTKEEKIDTPLSEQAKHIISYGKREDNGVNEQTITFISPYSQSGTTILAENFTFAFLKKVANEDINVAFIDFSFPPKATFHLKLSEMFFPLNGSIKIDPKALSKYWQSGDPKYLLKESIEFSNKKARIFQAFGSVSDFRLINKRPAAVSQFISDLKKVYPIIIISASNGFAMPIFDAIIKQSTSVIEVMKYIKNILPDDLAEFLIMHNEIAKFNLDKVITVINKVDSNLTRAERDMYKMFAPYVIIPAVKNRKPMKTVAEGTARFDLPIFIDDKNNTAFIAALASLMSEFFGG